MLNFQKKFFCALIRRYQIVSAAKKKVLTFKDQSKVL